MNRRKFINLSTAASVCTLTASALPASIYSADKEKKYSLKVTVLKRTVQQEFSNQFRDGKVEACPQFKDGQEFMVNSVWSAPEGFCHWAWADLRTLFHIVNSGTMPLMVGCCTDGFRPVFFKIERVELKI